eukprot:jgi/Mesvir1/23571/Mv18267-RA.1
MGCFSRMHVEATTRHDMLSLQPEAAFLKVHGIVSTQVGYAGGTTENPTYHNMGDHSESVQLSYDPNVITYEQLLDLFWTMHDPMGRRSRQYMSAIFTHDERQMAAAQRTFQEQAAARGPRPAG